MESRLRFVSLFAQRVVTERVAILFVIVLLSEMCAAQTRHTLSGVVIDPAGAVVTQAAVELRVGKHVETARTDDAGTFLVNVPAASGSASGLLTITALGFSTKRIEVFLTDDTHELQVRLEPAPVIERIQIEPNDRDNANSQVVLSHEDVVKSPAVAIDDALRQVPGFSLFRRSGSLTANPTSQGVSLRGVGANGASRALVLIDGVPFNSPFGSWVYWQRLPRDAIDNIAVTNGPASDSYGNGALGGVVNIETRRVEEPFVESDLSIGNETTAAASVIGGALVRGFGVTGAVQALRTDGYVLVAKESRGVVDTPAGTGDISGYVMISRQLKGDGRVFVRGNSFGESRKNGTPLQVNNSRMWSIDLGADRRITSYGDFSARVYGSREIFNQVFSAVAADRNSESLTNRQRNPSQQFGAALQWRRLFGARNLILAGFEGRYVRGHSAETTFAASRPTASIDAGGRQITFAAFGQDSVHFRHWTLGFGGRVDRWTNRGFSNRVPVTGTSTTASFPDRIETAFSPRASIAWDVGRGFLFSASFYRAFRAPTLNELYRSFRVGSVVTNANSDLRAERLTGGEAGFAFHEFSERATLRANVFWSQIADPVANVTIASTPTVITRRRQNLGVVRARGLEAGATFKIAASLILAAQYLLTDTTVLRLPVNRALEGLLVPQIPRHQFSFQLTFNRARWLVSAQGRLTSTQFDDDLNLLPLRQFFTVDAQVSRRLSKQFEIYFAAQNLTGVRYDVGRTPVLTTGPPALVRVGCRITVR